MYFFMYFYNMIDYTLEFEVDTGNITFIDNSDYTDYTNIASTTIFITEPTIGAEDPVYFDLLGSILNDLGEVGNNVVIPLSEDKIVDGIYKAEYTITHSGGTTTTTKYFLKKIDLLDCKKDKILDLIKANTVANCGDTNCTTNCDIVHFDTLIGTADYEASISNYKNAEDIVKYLQNLCLNCDC